MPKVCYAELLGGCEGQISREHPLPESVLHLIDQGKGVQTRGLSWVKDETKFFPPSALATRILCERHNSAISKFDAELKHAQEMIFDAIRDAHANRSEEKRRVVDGDRLQFALLKVLCSLIASQYSKRIDGTLATDSLPEQWVRVLFGAEPWPSAWHLGVVMGRNPPTAILGVEAELGILHTSEGPAALEYKASGVMFLLMILPGNVGPEETYLPRPQEVVFKHRDSELRHSVQIDWSHHPRGKHAPLYTLHGESGV